MTHEKKKSKIILLAKIRNLTCNSSEQFFFPEDLKGANPLIIARNTSQGCFVRSNFVSESSCTVWCDIITEKHHRTLKGGGGCKTHFPPAGANCVVHALYKAQSQKAADVWKKDGWDFQALSQTFFATFPRKLRNVPVTPTPSILPKVLPYKWGAYCRTIGRRTAVQMGGVLPGFPFLRSLEARKVRRYKWGRTAVQIGGVLPYFLDKL